MSTLTDQPTNKNFLSQIGFKFTINKTPNINYFVHRANLPGISLGSADIQTPFSRMPIAGDHLTFDDLTIEFKVDEDMKNYVELYNWILAIGFPDNFDQYKEIADQRSGPISGNVNRMTGGGVYSDATLTILSSAMRPIHNITYVDCYPLSIGDMTFSAVDADVQYLTCSATFRYRKFSIITL